MKLSIGHYITIAMIAFMSFILFLVFKATSTNVDLTAEDYYKQEIEYENIIEAKSNSVGLENEINLIQDGDFTQIKFSDKIDLNRAKGTVHFYKANNSQADQVFQFSPEKSLQAVKSADFEKGSYIIKVSWKIDDKDFYLEKPFTLH